MARYSRDFLIPYLQNICALHIVDKKLMDRCEYLQGTVQRLRNGRDNPAPRKPEMERIGCGAIGCIIMCGLMLVFAITGMVEASGIMVWLSLLFAAIFGGIAGYSAYEVRRNNAITLADYERKLSKHNEIYKLNKADLCKVAGVEQELNICMREQNNVHTIMQRVYGVNIIPSRYRNLYAAMYLYDWFSTGGSDDLDHALSMFVLEEIKEKLDRIIANQSDMILNQRIMIANQQRTIEHQRSHENMMRSKLNQIQATQEQQLGYVRMIESNTAVTAYFAAADYIRRI